MSGYKSLPPWGNHPSAVTWTMEEPCKKCHYEYVQACQSVYSGCTYYFCPSCGTDLPDVSGDEEEEGSE